MWPAKSILEVKLELVLLYYFCSDSSYTALVQLIHIELSMGNARGRYLSRPRKRHHPEVMRKRKEQRDRLEAQKMERDVSEFDSDVLFSDSCSDSANSVAEYEDDPYRSDVDAMSAADE